LSTESFALGVCWSTSSGSVISNGQAMYSSPWTVMFSTSFTTRTGSTSSGCVISSSTRNGSSALVARRLRRAGAEYVIPTSPFEPRQTTIRQVQSMRLAHQQCEPASLWPSADQSSRTTPHRQQDHRASIHQTKPCSGTTQQISEPHASRWACSIERAAWQCPNPFQYAERRSRVLQKTQ